MAQIKLLEDGLINKIAAGEVVERPANVVKELVENAVDSGATKVTVEIERGGRQLIRVQDNGTGMSQEDAQMSIQRHATSKLQSEDDLFNISTMGFRGEALASIASVSRFCLQTKLADSDSGVRLEAEGGKDITCQSWEGVNGTSVAIKDLFYNLPARQSFMKSDAAEYSQCLELIQAYALSIPHIAFELKHNGKVQLNIPAVARECDDFIGESSLRARALCVLNETVASQLIYLRKSYKFGHIEALISPPGVEKSNAKTMYTFVNNRWVKDKLLRFAITRGYHSHLLKGRYPVVVMHYRTEPSLVDVNVHPAKTELRFQYSSEVQGFLAMAMRENLRQGAWAQPHESSQDSENALPVSDVPAFVPETETVTRSGSSYSFRPQSSSFNSSKAPASRTSYQEQAYRVGAPSPMASVGAPPALPLENEIVSTTGETIPWSQLEFIGAFARCYLFFSYKDQLMVLDQHAFHERVLFERLLQNPKMLSQRQPLLVPEEIEMDASQISYLIDHVEQLKLLGFNFNKVSETSLEILSVPSILQNKDIQHVLAELSQDLDADCDFSRLEDVAENILATMACHAAVRAGEELGENELKVLMNEAHTVDFYHNCPHGRRVFRWFKLSQVAGWFDR